MTRRARHLRPAYHQVPLTILLLSHRHQRIPRSNQNVKESDQAACVQCRLRQRAVNLTIVDLEAQIAAGGTLSVEEQATLEAQLEADLTEEERAAIEEQLATDTTLTEEQQASLEAQLAADLTEEERAAVEGQLAGTDGLVAELEAAEAELAEAEFSLANGAETEAEALSAAANKTVTDEVVAVNELLGIESVAPTGDTGTPDEGAGGDTTPQ